MPLIHCPDCSSEVSDSALKCPKCGLQLRKPTRSFFGKIIKWAFIAYNILMPIWLIGGVNSATKGVEALSTAEQAGTVIGTGIGAMMIITIWVVGDFILGLFMLLTRPK